MIYDNMGNRWVVNSAEPATSIISKLHRRHYAYIVLPARLLATGIDDGVTPGIEGVIESQRMYDCLHVIRDAQAARPRES